MKLFLLAFFLLSGVAMSSSSYGQDTGAQAINIPAMMEEVKAYTISENIKTHDYITEIVERHIPIGADEEEVVAAFNAAGFKANDNTEKDYNKNERKKYDKIFFFISDFSLAPKYFWKHKIGILVKCKDGKVAYRSGSISYGNPILRYLP